MSLNLVPNEKSKYEVVKILGTQIDHSQNCLKVLKLVRVKKQPKINMPAFINLDEDDEEKVIEIDDSDNDLASLSYDNLVQNNTSDESKLIISSVTSAQFTKSPNPKESQTKMELKPLPAVISITTDDVNNTNIYEELEKVQKSLSKNSSYQEKEAESLKGQKIEVNPLTAEKALREAGQLSNRTKRIKKVPQKLLGFENYKPLVIKLRLSETQDSTKHSTKRKQYEIIAPEKPQKIQRKSGKLTGTMLEKAPVSSNANEDDNKIKDNKSHDINFQPGSLTYKVHKKLFKLDKIDASKYEIVKESDLKSYRDQERLKKSSAANQAEKSPIQEPTVHHNSSQLSKISPSQMVTEKQNFISKLNLQMSKLSENKLEADSSFLFPPTPPATPEDSRISHKLPSPPGSYLMKLKCHKTCSNIKAHNKKHKVDFSSSLGLLLTKRDVTDETYIKDSQKRIEEFTKTPIFDKTANAFIDPLHNSKTIRPLKVKVGRKSEVSNVLAEMREAGIDRNFMIRG
ncbi:hypothetical protein ACKWTF_016647 [Chironomus riparius]